MGNIKSNFRRFMYSRNGLDECAKVSIIAALVVDILAVIFRQNILSSISLVFLYYALFRIFSGNKEKRYLENRKFTSHIQVLKLNFECRKTHKIFVCKRCGKKIRVPKGKGKIEMTCPLCGNRTVHRT